MRTTVDIDRDLLTRAMAATEQATPTAAVEAALRLAILADQAEAVRRLTGLGWCGNLGESREGRF